jgi:uncharacterized glyoxalase superfamily protein PhnB
MRLSNPVNRESVTRGSVLYKQMSIVLISASATSFMNIRVANVQASYELWRSRGAEFITEPKEQYGETYCYLRDPDGYLIEVGQSKPGFAYG